MKKKHELYDIAVIPHAETEKALLVSLTGHTKDAVWVPKSLCELDGNILTLPEWLAEEKDLL